MEVTADSPAQDTPARARKRRLPRLLAILLLGVIAIGVSIGVRNSTWAHERRLKALSVEELALAIHDDPYDALTFLYYGSALLKAGDLENSAHAFQRATQLDPKMERAFLGLGSVQLRQGNLDGAGKSFKEAIRLDPKDTGAYLGLSQVAYQAGSPHGAIEPLKKIVELEPKNALAWYNLGKMYGEARQSDLAYDAIQKAIAIDPRQAEFWRNLGQVARHYSHLQEAEQDFKKAISLDPKDPVTHYWLGTLYMQLGDTPAIHAQAEQELRAGIALDPGMPEAYFDLGQLAERQGDWRKAVENYQAARKLDLSDDQSLYHLGLCLVKLGQKAEGQKLTKAGQALAAAKLEVQNMENRIIAQPQNRDLRLKLARLYRKYGNDEYAITEYQIYQRLGPADPAVAKEIDAYRSELQKEQQRQPSPAAPPQQ